MEHDVFYVQQPEIEFLATDVFGLIQTGSKKIANLTSTYLGPMVLSFYSNEMLSPLFGTSIQASQAGCILFTSAGNELALTGNQNTSEPFTMGAYFHLPTTYSDCAWTLVVKNASQLPNNFASLLAVGEINKAKRLCIRVTSSYFAVKYFINNNPYEAIRVNHAHSGWTHVAVTFNGRYIGIYLNGIYFYETEFLKTGLNTPLYFLTFILFSYYFISFLSFASLSI